MCLINSIQYHYPLSDVNMVNKQHQCSRCEFKAVKKDHLQTHIKSVHEGQKFQCPHCEHKATRKINLQKHIKSAHADQTLQYPYFDHKATMAIDEYFEADVKSEVQSDVELE